MWAGPRAESRGGWHNTFRTPDQMSPRVAQEAADAVRLVVVAVHAHQAFDAVAVRTFAALRALHVAYLVGYLIVWRAWYADNPAGLTAAVATGLWGVVFVSVALRRGTLSRPLIAANIAVAAVVGLGGLLCVPELSVGGSGTWAFSAATQAAYVSAWACRRRVLVAVVALLITTWVIGAAIAQATMADPAAGGNHTPLLRAGAASLLLLGLSGLFRAATSRLRAAALDADSRLHTALADRHAAAVAAARLRDERERERTLHDTVLNTLTGIAWGGGSRDRAGILLTAEQCHYTIAAVRTMLDGTTAATRDLTEPILRVISLARARGLRVDVWSLPATDLPEDVVRALAGATQELLANVRRHADTDHAELAVGTRPDGGVEIVVADSGRGFLVDEVPDDRLGLARSVHARLTEVGGHATLESTPGVGTAVRLAWSPGATPAIIPGGNVPAPRRDGPLAAPDGSRGAAEVWDRYSAALRRTVAGAAACWCVVTAVVLVLTLPEARSIPLDVGCWLAMALVSAAATWTSYRRPLRRAEAGTLIALALAIVVTVGVAVLPVQAEAGAGGPPSRIGAWPVLMLPVLLAVVAASGLFVEWIVAIVATVAVLDLVVLQAAGTGPLALAQLLAATNSQIALQIIIAMAGPVLRRTADQAARAIEEEAARAALRQSAEAIRADREQGLATIEGEVLPLLEAIADGLLDPRDPAVRERCGQRAIAIRRDLVGATGALGDLAPAITPAVMVARAEGLEVEVRVVGESGGLPRAWTEALAGLLPTVFGAAVAAGARRAVLAVLHEDHGGQIFLTYPATVTPAVPSFPPPDGVVSVSADVDDDQVCVEIAWSAPQPAAAPLPQSRTRREPTADPP